MQNKFKPFLTELIWLTLAFGLSNFLVTLVISNSALDIHLHDTYFVGSPWLISTTFFLLITFILYFIKEKRKSFIRTPQNWFIVILGLTLIVFLGILIQSFSRIINGWTLYSPLSSLGNSKEPEISTIPITKFVANLLTLIQFIVLTILLYFTYRWWTQKRSRQKE